MSSKTLQVVIDTNVLITTINRRNFEFFIYQAFEQKKFSWVVSTEILNEYAEQLANFYSVNTANYVLDVLCTAANVVFAESYFHWNLIDEDPDDNKFADLAISSSSDALITFDKHFNVFKELEFPSLTILTPKEFRSLLMANRRNKGLV